MQVILTMWRRVLTPIQFAHLNVAAWPAHTGAGCTFPLHHGSHPSGAPVLCKERTDVPNGTEKCTLHVADVLRWCLPALKP